MSKRTDVINKDSLSGLLRHHPYLQILQKEDWREYLLLLSEIYDRLEEQSGRMPIEVLRTLAFNFYSQRDLSFVDQKVSGFFSMAIGELDVLRDSHDSFGQRYLEPTRSGKLLLQLFEGLLAQRGKFSGTGAETLLGALNDILISRRQMTEAEALMHHKERVEAYRADMIRIRKGGLQAAQLLPIAHSNEALFAQAEEAAIHVLGSIEEVKTAIEVQRQELAAVYFQGQRSAGQVLGAVADFYERLYASPSYASYMHAKELLSHLEGYEARFSVRNVDRLLHVIEGKDLLPMDTIKRSNLKAFMHQFHMADVSIQDKIRSQIQILQRQVLYAVATDVEGLNQCLHDILSLMAGSATQCLGFCETHPIVLEVRSSFDFGPVELFAFELPIEVAPQELSEETFDLNQERELLLALVEAEEGTLKDILSRLNEHLDREGRLRASEHAFSRGLAEYYVLSEIDLFDVTVEKQELELVDLHFQGKHSEFVLRKIPNFELKRKDLVNHG